MSFEKNLANYVKLIVTHGLNVQKGQIVNIAAEAIHRELCWKVAQEAYRVGASFVNIDLIEPRLQRLRALSSTEKEMNYVPAFVQPKYNELVSSQAASLRIIGLEYPELLSDLDPRKLNLARIAQYKAMEDFYKEGISKSKLHWTIAAAATEGWAQRIFQDKEPAEAKKLLWEQIFAITRSNRDDVLEVWAEHNRTLQLRARRLTDLGIKSLRFEGPGTDLQVGLSSRAIFKGGGDVGPYGVEYEPNIPTEECFTTPDYRATSGKVRATRPFLINGKLIKGLELEFREGEIVFFKAAEGTETFKEYIASDKGASRLGEVALVGIDSPVYQSGLIFEEILFDENAACHIAVGSAYKFCLAEGDKLTAAELESVGCNESTVHTDMMISSQEVDVTAETYGGSLVKLIEKGAWVDF
jgi:aminopeptidase